MVDNSHVDPQFDDASSLDKTFDSEVSGFSCSFSLPSEPIDVGNWFSSYIYESPVIETGEESNCLISGENESEKVELDSKMIVKKEVDFGELQNPIDKDGSVFDVESELEKQAIDKGKSDFFVPKIDENESFDGNVVEEQGHNLVPFIDDVDSPQNVDGKFSCSSDLSEPPDIRNWFSSYVYESPILDAGEEVNGAVLGDSQVEKVGLGKVFSREKEDEHQNHSAGNSVLVFGCGDNEHRNYSAVKDKSISFITNTTENRSLTDEVVCEHNLVSLKDDPAPFLRNINYPPILDSRISLGGDSILSKRKKSSSAYREKENLHESNICKENLQDLRKSNLFVPKRLSCINSNEEEIRSVTPNGFISTKKKHCTGKIGGNVLESTPRNNQVLGETQTIIARRPFSERTNIFSNEAAAKEITGKWKCPQKSKPDLGHPMKQQRLERWIHRV
ncbi:hypothetical protein C5167_032313 [Papaver somniferum]|uniref:Uncharacterized protein n=1 Tax=Papaver somniferum TaxID=3469 RepID=A0A4Y7KB94_PAPSO|nr:uncharacterized protein LOC113292649 [Papaver somniferum]RZC69219.1 hypothetical protein C5167_032313 [Papaver somniferum]